MSCWPAAPTVPFWFPPVNSAAPIPLPPARSLPLPLRRSAAIDGDTAQVGPQIAEKLGMPQITYVSEIKVDGEHVICRRMLEDGYMTIKTHTPCLLTCIKELNTPRYMSVGGIFECYNKPLEVYNFETLKDDPLIELDTIGLKGSPTNVYKSFSPPQKGAGMMLEGADKATCEKLVSLLAEKHII